MSIKKQPKDKYIGNEFVVCPVFGGEHNGFSWRLVYTSPNECPLNPVVLENAVVKCVDTSPLYDGYYNCRKKGDRTVYRIHKEQLVSLSKLPKDVPFEFEKHDLVKLSRNGEIAEETRIAFKSLALVGSVYKWLYITDADRKKVEGLDGRNRMIPAESKAAYTVIFAVPFTPFRTTLCTRSFTSEESVLNFLKNEPSASFIVMRGGELVRIETTYSLGGPDVRT